MSTRPSFGAVLFALCLPASAPAADLHVDIEGIRAQGGVVKVIVLGSAAAWNGKAPAVASSGVKPDGDGGLSVRFDDLAPGRYAVRVMHDENGNRKLDTNFVGIPSEGYGFSNNPRAMRPATFGEARFEVPAEGARTRIRLR